MPINDTTAPASDEWELENLDVRTVAVSNALDFGEGRERHVVAVGLHSTSGQLTPDENFKKLWFYLLDWSEDGAAMAYRHDGHAVFRDGFATYDIAVRAFSDGPIPSVAVFATGGSIPQRRCNAAQGCDEDGLECVATPTGGSYCAAKTSFQTVRGQLRLDENGAFTEEPWSYILTNESIDSIGLIDSGDGTYLTAVRRGRDDRAVVSKFRCSHSRL